MPMDFVMESDTEDFIVSVYYSERRGGSRFQCMQRHLHALESLCNQTMHFFPNVMAMCIYSGTAGGPRVYTRRVNGGGAPHQGF